MLSAWAHSFGKAVEKCNFLFGPFATDSCRLTHTQIPEQRNKFWRFSWSGTFWTKRIAWISLEFARFDSFSRNFACELNAHTLPKSFYKFMVNRFGFIRFCVHKNADSISSYCPTEFHFIGENWIISWMVRNELNVQNE